MRSCIGSGSAGLVNRDAEALRSGARACRARGTLVSSLTRHTRAPLRKASASRLTRMLATSDGALHSYIPHLPQVRRVALPHRAHFLLDELVHLLRRPADVSGRV